MPAISSSTRQSTARTASSLLRVRLATSPMQPISAAMWIGS
jgi:hypothetical protein